jgi:hypothetical protein
LPEHIGAGTDRLLRKATVDERPGQRRHADVGRGIRVAEGRTGIPHVGHRWVVVDRDAVDEVDVFPRQVPGSADVGVVQRAVVANAVVGPLRESTDRAIDAAGVEEARLLQDGVTVADEVEILLVDGARVGARDLHHP